MPLRPLPRNVRLRLGALAALGVVLEVVAVFFTPLHSLPRVTFSVLAAAIVLYAVFSLLQTRRAW